MIKRASINCRIVLEPGLAPSQRLALMEILEKAALAMVGAKPSKLVGADSAILFTADVDRTTAIWSLRQCLPPDMVRDVVIDGRSWNE